MCSTANSAELRPPRKTLLTVTAKQGVRRQAAALPLLLPPPLPPGGVTPCRGPAMCHCKLPAVCVRACVLILLSLVVMVVRSRTPRSLSLL